MLFICFKAYAIDAHKVFDKSSEQQILSDFHTWLQFFSTFKMSSTRPKCSRKVSTNTRGNGVNADFDGSDEEVRRGQPLERKIL